MILSRIAKKFSQALFAIAIVLYPILTAVVIFNVVLRYVFGIGSIELEELQWHIYAAAFLLGLPEVFRQDLNIRVDFAWRHLPDGTKRAIETAGLLLLILPFLIIFSYYAFYFFERSWALSEISPHSSGLPARFVIKLVLFISFTGLLLQALIALLERLRVLSGNGQQD